MNEDDPLWKLQLAEVQRRFLVQQELDKQRRKYMDEIAEWAKKEIKPSPKGVPT